MAIVFAATCVLLLAGANGANDNFKGVATLLGSGIAGYRRALNWATATTLAGSVAAIWLSAQLVETFSGKLFVPAATLALAGFAPAVCAAAAATVLLATRIGAPVSTTHALAGALIGAALAAPGAVVDWARAGTVIFLPLAVGPLLAVVAAMLLYPVLSALRRTLGVTRESCICIGSEWLPQPGGTALAAVSVVVEPRAVCQQRYRGAVLGFQAQGALDGLHFCSAGLVGFARGVNDTPKIAALALMALPLLQSLALPASFGAVGIAIAAGGLLGARNVAQTMAGRITAMNPGQGLTANLITSALVLSASPLGLPLSTTHVSCGALFGIGAITGQARWPAIAGICGAWLVTLPLALLFGAAFLAILF